MKRVIVFLLITLLLIGCVNTVAPASETEEAAASETAEQPQDQLTVGGFLIATLVVGGALFFFRYQARKRAERYEFYRR